jgi:hypothetical protein
VTRLSVEQRHAAREGQWIYAIQAGGYGGDIKIGISRDPARRLATLQVGHAETLRLVGMWPGTAEDEKALHEMYASTRLRGEWFMHSLPMWRLIRDFTAIARRACA